MKIIVFCFGVLLGVSAVTNSEVYWFMFGKAVLEIVSGLVIIVTLGSSYFFFRSKKKTDFQIRFVLLLLSFSAIFGLGYLSIENLDLFPVVKAVFSFFIIFFVFSIDLPSSSRSVLIGGLGMAFFCGAAITIMLQGDVDSIGNILSASVCVAVLFYFYISKTLSLVLIVIIAVLGFVFVARTASYVALIALVLLLLSGGFLSRSRAISSLQRILNVFVAVTVCVVYASVLFVAHYYSRDSYLNELLTYRPLIWGVSVVQFADPLLWFVPADFFRNTGLLAGYEVLDYFRWTSEVKSYSSHNMLIALINRWGVIPGGGFFLLILSFLWRIRNEPRHSIPIFLLFIVGAFSSLVPGTSNMFGLVLLVIVLLLPESVKRKQNSLGAE